MAMLVLPPEREFPGGRIPAGSELLPLSSCCTWRVVTLPGPLRPCPALVTQPMAGAFQQFVLKTYPIQKKEEGAGQGEARGVSAAHPNAVGLAGNPCFSGSSSARSVALLGETPRLTHKVSAS